MISLFGVAWIGVTVGYSDFLSIFSKELHYEFPPAFTLIVILIMILFGIRWRLLFEGRLGYKDACLSTIFCIGGNMFLPVRGGELLRLHHTRSVVTMRMTGLLSRLIAEKVIDLLSIAIVGVIAAFYFWEAPMEFSASVLMFGAGMTMIVVAGVLTIKFCRRTLLRVIRPIFKLIKRDRLFERYIVRMFAEMNQIFSMKLISPPAILTILIWLIPYAASYYCGGKVVGVNLSYGESFFILCAGALGLMLPAAPSGIGVLHASVVSSFIALGRPAAEGLLFATVVHLLYFLIVGLPTIFIYSYWHFKHHRNHSTENYA